MKQASAKTTEDLIDDPGEIIKSGSGLKNREPFVSGRRRRNPFFCRCEFNCIDKSFCSNCRFIVSGRSEELQSFNCSQPAGRPIRHGRPPNLIISAVGSHAATTDSRLFNPPIIIDYTIKKPERR